jgi:hypothetical protein
MSNRFSGGKKYNPRDREEIPLPTQRGERRNSRVDLACAILLLAAFAMPTRAIEVSGHGSGGGPPPPLPPQSECVPDAFRTQVEARVIANLGLTRAPKPYDGGTIVHYPFVPIAGTEWQDRFVNNFVDLNSSSPGILDWDCTDFTYDGHQGHDILLRSFGEQDVGVPVFAALDGTVADAHDGEFDKNVAALGQPANYVVLYHGNTHYTWYWHLRSNSVAVAINQVVKAGTQLGLAASSGNSTAPHLHFESRYGGTFFEPSAGACNAGSSYWVNQIPIRRDMWVEDFAVHNTNDYPSGAFLPYNPYRAGTIVRNGTSQPIGIWYIIHNLPASSSWRVRYLRPNATLFYDSGSHPFGNPFYRYASWWLYYGLNPDIAGQWSIELSINGQVMVTAPFTVLNAGGTPVNRPPGPVTAVFDPVAPTTNDVVFCRLTVPLLEDPDYDLVRFRFTWRTNGQVFRDVTNAAFSDAAPRGSVGAASLLSCTVTPFDGLAFGTSTIAQAIMPGGSGIRLSIASPAANKILIQWPTSAIPYVLESAPALASNWSAVTNSVAVVGAQNVVSNNFPAASRYYRLRWP